MRKILMVGLALAVLGAVTSPVAAAVPRRPAAPRRGPESDLERVGPDLNGGKPLPIAPGARALARQAGAAPAQVGDHKLWLAFDHQTNQLNLKDFVLRAVGQHIEVWTGSNLRFPAGDCRNDDRVQISDDQVRYLIGQFDENIYPIESAVLSVPPARDGARATLPGLVGLPPDYYAGDGERVVALIDNIRDRNY